VAKSVDVSSKKKPKKLMIQLSKNSIMLKNATSQKTVAPHLNASLALQKSDLLIWVKVSKRMWLNTVFALRKISTGKIESK
jgi:hypothetical protein